MEYSLSILFILFILYSFLGWAFETILCSLRAKKIVDRGFLIGPLCPIYGTASIIGLFLLKPYFNDIIVIFVFSTILATFIEYFTSYILEKLFKIRWWDYSEMPFNLNGRIVLSNSLSFGVMGLLIIYILNPLFMNLLDYISINILNLTAIILLILFTIDTTLTSNILFSIKADTKEMLKDRTEEVGIIIRKKISNQLLLTKRLLNSFPNLKPIHKNLSIQEKIKNFLNNKKSS